MLYECGDRFEGAVRATIGKCKWERSRMEQDHRVGYSMLCLYRVEKWPDMEGDLKYALFAACYRRVAEFRKFGIICMEGYDEPEALQNSDQFFWEWHPDQLLMPWDPWKESFAGGIPGDPGTTH